MFEYISLLLFIILFVVIFFLWFDYQEKSSIHKKIINFNSYIAVLEYYMQKAYDIIYKDRILIFSLEATKINDKEFDIVTKDYVYLVLKLIGPSLKEEFINLYGDEQTFIFNIVEYFNSRYETDAIREKAKENIFTEEEKKLF